MFNSELFSKMRKGAFLINCARGELVNEVALAEALSGVLAGAAIDVFNQSHQQGVLIKLDNVYFTRISVFTHEAQSAVV